MGGRTNGRILFIAPIPEATFLDHLSICVCHRRFSSINIPSDLTKETCSIATLSIESISGFDKVLNFCLEPISINSVLVLFKVESFYNVLYTLPLFVRRHRLLERAIHTFLVCLSAQAPKYTLFRLTAWALRTMHTHFPLFVCRCSSEVCTLSLFGNVTLPLKSLFLKRECSEALWARIVGSLLMNICAAIVESSWIMI